MASLTTQMQKAADEAGVDVGNVYKVAKAGIETRAYTDVGVFVEVTGVPGAYLLPDGRKVSFR